MVNAIQGIPEKCIHIRNNCKCRVLLKFYYSRCVKIFTNDVCFFTACSQTDAHFDPDTADNAKQQNCTHHETIPLVFGHIHVRWLLSN